MTEPTKIQAELKGDAVEVRVRMAHAMETGQRKDAAGKTLPAHFIQSVTASLNGKPVLQAQLGTAISRNPYFGFRVKGARAGDKLAVTWTDNKGESRTDEATIA